uniref:SAM domain-containing protein n=1 Tax=Meloidogyne incognita TaxID=6306 RepID=A0A914KXS3_MELIC
MSELKVQVDRRRLEAMIIGEIQGENAETFFNRVEKITGAKVYWPSRLKIKAKTKKDVVIKLIGCPLNIQKAALIISERLRVKKEKATLKMEISHCLHSQVIGRAGKNTQQIMRDTGCHIHFPDSNKVLSPTLPQAKNDQVSISGCVKDVEKARELLRASGPLTISVNIQLSLSRSVRAIQPRLDPVYLQRHFNPNNSNNDLNIQFSPCGLGPLSFGSLHFVMRSSTRNELEMLRAFGKICQLIGIFPTGEELFCYSQFEIRSSALPSLSALRWIAFRTNTQIQLNAQGLLISGPLEGIFVARKFITGLLPVSLQFEKPTELPTPSNSLLRILERELDLQISEKRKRKMPKINNEKESGNDEREYIICTYEANLFNVYLARNKLLQINNQNKISESPEKSKEENADSDDQFPQDNDRAALMRSLCRESLLITDQQQQQQPLISPSNFSLSVNETKGFLNTNKIDWGNQLENICKLNLLEEDGGGGPKSPDPQESPIAAGLLAGAKSVNLQKGEFRKILDCERLRLRNTAINTTNKSIFVNENNLNNKKEKLTSNDIWAIYGFSSSLPTELFSKISKNNSKNIWNEEENKIKGRPIVGRGNEEEEEENNYLNKEEEEEEEEEKNKIKEENLINEKKLLPIFNENILPPPPLPPPTSSSQLLNSNIFSTSTNCISETFPTKSTTNNLNNQILTSDEGDEKEENNNKLKNQLIETKKATALVHPRVAALQAGEQQKRAPPKFAMSAGSSCFFETSTNNITPNFRIPNENKSSKFQLNENNNNECTQQQLPLPPPPPLPSPLPPSPQWDIRVLTEPSSVLTQLGLSEHISLFREQEIDMQAFLLLDEPCLNTLGVSTLGARKKIMHAVTKLRESARRYGIYSL